MGDGVDNERVATGKIRRYDSNSVRAIPKETQEEKSIAVEAENAKRAYTPRNIL